MKDVYEQIRKELEGGNVQNAIALADRHLSTRADDTTLHYLRGRAYMKKADWREATNNFLRAEQLDKNSPAAEARRMIDEILEFYNKDLYNP